MDFPNFNYTPEVFRTDRKLKTICRLCAVGCRPGASRNAALVPRKTESGTVVSLRVPGAAQSQGPTISGAKNPWGKILGLRWGGRQNGVLLKTCRQLRENQVSDKFFSPITKSNGKEWWGQDRHHIIKKGKICHCSIMSCTVKHYIKQAQTL